MKEGMHEWLRPAAPPPPRHGTLLCTLILQQVMDAMVYSPRPPCGTGYPSASAASPSPTAAVLCSASCGIPSPTPAVLWFSNCACGPGRKENPPPPLWNRMVFPFAYTHTQCLCECMAILSPNPPPVEQDGFPFCAETHTHNHTHTHRPRVCVCMAFSLRTCSPAKPPFHSFPPFPPHGIYPVIYSCT